MKKRVDSSYVSRKAYTNVDTWKKGPYCGCLRWFELACVLSKTRAENCSEATIKKSQNKRNDKNKKKNNYDNLEKRYFLGIKKAMLKRKKKKKKKGLRGINILPKFFSSWAIKNHQRFIHSDRLALMILLMLIIIIFIFFFLACIALIVWVESPISLCFFFVFLLFSLCSTVACACFCWFFWQPAGPRPGLLLFKA